ncbi:MAG: N-acetylmuramoyl-L-alanine amidase [Bacteroidetes bacterium]|nr:N-acetylmuramoyl-L-alanine amidase [Bacteroidota bacterium]
MATPGKNGTVKDIILNLRMRLVVIVPLLLLSTSGFVSPVTKEFVVVIDAGHGGRDPGAIGSASREKDIVLAIALKTGNYIKQNLSDVKVVYTREKDVFIELDRRADIANKNNADLFISIHTNAVRQGVSRNVAGSETFVLGTDKENQNLSVVMKENEVITLEENYTTRYEGYDPKSPESFIIFSLMQNVYLKQSLELATLIQNQFRERAGRIDRGVKQGGFLVLWMTTMPSVLVETGFISNPAEEKFLKSEQGQDYIASAIFRAFREYKSNIDKRSSFTTVREEPVKTQTAAVTAAGSAEIFFTVQIATTREKKDLNPANFRGLTDLFEYPATDRYRYTSGKFRSYQEAVDYRKNITDKYPDAFVIAFRGNTTIPLSQAIEATTKR